MINWSSSPVGWGPYPYYVFQILSENKNLPNNKITDNKSTTLPSKKKKQHFKSQTVTLVLVAHANQYQSLRAYVRALKTT